MTRSKQITLFDGKDSYWEIKKHSSLVQMGNVGTHLQRKLMDVSIWITRDQLKRNPQQQRFWTEIGILWRLMKFKDGSNKTLKEALISLRRTEFEYNIFHKDKQKRANFSFFSDVEIESQWRGRPTYVYREYPSRVLNVIKDPKMYAKLNLLILMGLESKYSYALYSHLQDYVRLGRFRCKPNDYRSLMGIQNGQYESFSMLADRTIKVPVEEINAKTDIKIEYTIDRIGRKPDSILFHMEPNKKNLMLVPDGDEICEKLKAYWIQNHQINKLFKLHTSQYLLANIAVVEEKLKNWQEIRNIPGYLMSAFEIDFTPKETEHDKLEKQKAEEKKLEAKKIEKEEFDLLILESKFKEEKSALINKLKNSLTEEDFIKLKTEFESKIQEIEFFSTAYQAKGFDDYIIQGQRNKFLTERFLPLEYQSFENYKEKKVRWMCVNLYQSNASLFIFDHGG